MCCVSSQGKPTCQALTSCTSGCAVDLELTLECPRVLSEQQAPFPWPCPPVFLGKPLEFSCSKEGDKGPFPKYWLPQVKRTGGVRLRLPLCASRCHPPAAWSSTCSGQVACLGHGLIPRELHVVPKSQAMKYFDLASTSKRANLHA